MKTEINIRYKIYIIVLFLSANVLKSRAQTVSETPVLTRFEKGRSLPGQIPLTRFFLIKNARVQYSDWPDGWVMPWDIAVDSNKNLLLIEMNGTDVRNYSGEVTTSGSVQLVVELAGIINGHKVKITSNKMKEIHFINNYSDLKDKKRNITGELELKDNGRDIIINCSLLLSSKRSDNKQQINIIEQKISRVSVEEYLAMEKKKSEEDSLQLEELSHAIVAGVIARDSIMSLKEDSLKRVRKSVPYTGDFRFWVSDVDKAAWERNTYSITDDSLIIKEGGYNFMYFAKNYPGDSVYYRKQLNNKQKTILKRIGQQLATDTLAEDYSNRCIMDGLILYFYLEWKGKIKEVSVSNFYVPEFVELIDFVNDICPKKYKIWYGKETLIRQQEYCDSVISTRRH